MALAYLALSELTRLDIFSRRRKMTMTRSRSLFLALIGVLLVWSSAPAASLDSVKNDELLRILTSIKLVESFDQGVQHVSIFVANSSGADECDPHREAKTCPHQRLYIAASGADGIPTTLWRSSSQIGWSVESPAIRDDSQLLVLRVHDCEAPRDVESGKVDARRGGWWKQRSYLLKLSLNGIELKPSLEPEVAAVEQDCDLY